MLRQASQAKACARKKWYVLSDARGTPAHNGQCTASHFSKRRGSGVIVEVPSLITRERSTQRDQGGFPTTRDARGRPAADCKLSSSRI